MLIERMAAGAYPVRWYAKPCNINECVEMEGVRRISDVYVVDSRDKHLLAGSTFLSRWYHNASDYSSDIAVEVEHSLSAVGHAVRVVKSLENWAVSRFTDTKMHSLTEVMGNPDSWMVASKAVVVQAELRYENPYGGPRALGAHTYIMVDPKAGNIPSARSKRVHYFYNNNVRQALGWACRHIELTEGYAVKVAKKLYALDDLSILDNYWKV